MTAGYSGTPLARKLGIKEGHRVATIAAPDHFPALLDPLPPDVQVTAAHVIGVQVAAGPGDEGPYDVIVAFVPDAGPLAARFAWGAARLRSNGGLWVAWPKQSSPLASEFRGADVRAHGLSTGLVDNKICAVDADWSGLRFVVRKENRP